MSSAMPFCIQGKLFKRDGRRKGMLRSVDETAFSVDKWSSCSFVGGRGSTVCGFGAIGRYASGTGIIRCRFSGIKFTSMKRVVCIVAVLTLMGSMRLMAAKPKPAPMPENGYWEIVTREKGPAKTTVKFFDLENHLIYEERLEGVRLDGTNRRVCRRLNNSLQTALVAWEDSGRMMRDKGIVAALFR